VKDVSLPRPAAGLAPEDAFPGLLSQSLRNLHLAAGGAQEAAGEIEQAALLVGERILEGETFLDLALAREGVDGAALRRSLAGSPIVGKATAQGPYPLVLAGERLYLARYWDYEQQFNGVLRALNRPFAGIPEAALRAELDRHFPAGGPAQPDWQKAAAATAIQRHLCIISGGPGTGKTSTVVKILAILLSLNPALRIAIAAPTGKAAARVQESIRQQMDALKLPPAVVAAMPRESYTLHRLLGFRPGKAELKYNRDRRLPFDVVVVDEASMLDLALAAKLASALGEDSRLILLGDKDQLSSVEAGAVFAGISSRADAALADAVVWLEHSYRFGEASALGRLARAINSGDEPAVAAILDSGDAAVAWTRDLPAPAALAQQLAAGYEPYVSAIRAGRPPAEVFAALERYRVLCSTRAGRYGSAQLGRLLTGILRQRLGQPEGNDWFVGRAVLVTSNDYSLHLFNGDVGIVLPDASGTPLVHFQAGGGGIRAVSPMRVGHVEDATAITVHRSQGSEFGAVAVVLNPDVTRGLSKQLVYTAVTRAKERVSLFAQGL
jgi:exodeoxyribonuclease V alpha subunit